MDVPFEHGLSIPIGTVRVLERNAIYHCAVWSVVLLRREFTIWWLFDPCGFAANEVHLHIFKKCSKHEQYAFRQEDVS
jgi:hypothetical protein